MGLDVAMEWQDEKDGVDLHVTWEETKEGILRFAVSVWQEDEHEPEGGIYDAGLALPFEKNGFDLGTRETQLPSDLSRELLMAGLDMVGTTFLDVLSPFYEGNLSLQETSDAMAGLKVEDIQKYMKKTQEHQEEKR